VADEEGSIPAPAPDGKPEAVLCAFGELLYSPRMGSRGLVVLTALVLAGVFALASSANHEHIALQSATARVELADPFSGETVPLRFTWSPPDTLFARGEVLLCWNGHLDRARLTADVRDREQLCSSGSSGLQTANNDSDSTATYDALSAGRYETVVRRQTPCADPCYPPPPPHWNASNVVAVEVVDPCRLRLVSVAARGVDFPLEPNAPMACSTLLDSGALEAAGEDGSKIALTGTGPIYVAYNLRNNFSGRPLTAPVFRLKAGGTPASVTFTTRSRLGDLVTSASTGAVHVLAVAPAKARLTFRNGVGRVDVQSGRVVALGVGPYEAAWEIERYCRRRAPTIACLSKMRYRFFTMKPGTSLKARVLGAGQSATFRRHKGVIKFLR